MKQPFCIEKKSSYFKEISLPLEKALRPLSGALRGVQMTSYKGPTVQHGPMVAPCREPKRNGAQRDKAVLAKCPACLFVLHSFSSFDFCFFHAFFLWNFLTTSEQKAFRTTLHRWLPLTDAHVSKDIGGANARAVSVTERKPENPSSPCLLRFVEPWWWVFNCKAFHN